MFSKAVAGIGPTPFQTPSDESLVGSTPTPGTTTTEEKSGRAGLSSEDLGPPRGSPATELSRADQTHKEAADDDFGELR
jgi:hypothetical protein